MIEGPLGGAAFNNEFGRPNLAGYFRTYESHLPGLPDNEIRGYHKPIMVAGGVGNVRAEHANKIDVPVGARVVVLGGPAMLIGLGGGAASSLASGSSSEDLDFASVQRGNPEMERRAQEVIDRCWEMGDDNPILLIHDVGAGGLVERRAGGRRSQQARRRDRAARRRQCRTRHVADGYLVQRGAGALRTASSAMIVSTPSWHCANANVALFP